ncbi:MAG: hypothetical protein QW244_02585 [Candidatus Pacearchaeota archaeon]
MKKKMKSKKAWKLIALLLVSFLFISPFILAQGGQATSIGDIGRAIGKWIADAFGYSALTTGADWRFVTILVVIFFMLFFAFSDIIETFTMFKKSTSYILGFGLAVIAALTKGILKLAHYIFGITAGLGVLAVAIVIVSAFVALVIVHLGLSGFNKWIFRRKAMIEAHKKGVEIKKGMEILKEVGKFK